MSLGTRSSVGAGTTRARWLRAKLEWCAEHGSLNGMDAGDVLREHGRMARRMTPHSIDGMGESDE